VFYFLENLWGQFNFIKNILGKFWIFLRKLEPLVKINVFFFKHAGLIGIKVSFFTRG